MPPSSTLICATDEPKIAGSISRVTRRTPSCCSPHFGRGRARMRIRNGTWKSSWHSPATNTAYARAIPGSSSRGDSQTAPQISTTLSMTGVNAGTPKRP